MRTFPHCCKTLLHTRNEPHFLAASCSSPQCSHASFQEGTHIQFLQRDWVKRSHSTKITTHNHFKGCWTGWSHTPNLMNLRSCQRGIRLELKSCSDHSWRNTVIQICSYIFTSIQLKPPTTPKRRHCNEMVLCMCQAHYSNGLMILQHQRKISGPNSQLYFTVHRKSEALWTGWNEMVWPSILPPHWTSLHKKSYIPSAQLLDRSPLSNSASDTVSTDILLCHSMWKEKLVR